MDCTCTVKKKKKSLKKRIKKLEDDMYTVKYTLFKIEADIDSLASGTSGMTKHVQ